MITLRDFYPINQWKIESNPKIASLYQEKNDLLIDQTTGHKYWYLPHQVVSCKCLGLVVTAPLKLFTEAMTSLGRVITFRHYHPSEDKSWVRKGIQGTITDIFRACLILLSIPAFQLSALYGLIRPHDGRKLFTSFDRLVFSAPNLSTAFFKAKKAPPPISIATYPLLAILAFPGIRHSCVLLNTTIHETGHWLAMKTLFTGLHPWIEVNLINGSGLAHWGWGGGPLQLSGIGQYFTLNTADALVSLAGPLIQIVGAAIASVLSHRLSKDRKPRLITQLLEIFSFVSFYSNVKYSLISEEGRKLTSDYQLMSNSFKIPRWCWSAVAISLCTIPIYFSAMQRLRIRDVEEPF